MIWSLPSNRIRPHLLGGFELFKDTHCDRTQSDHAWDCGPFPHYRPGRHTGIGINVPFENGFFTCVQYPTTVIFVYGEVGVRHCVRMSAGSRF